MEAELEKTCIALQSVYRKVRKGRGEGAESIVLQTLFSGSLFTNEGERGASPLTPLLKKERGVGDVR